MWTCRSGIQLTQAVFFCKSYGLEFDAVNENLPDIIEKYGNDSRKISADIYIDDKALTNNFQLNLGTYLKEVLYEDFC